MLGWPLDSLVCIQKEHNALLVPQHTVVSFGIILYLHHLRNKGNYSRRNLICLHPGSQGAEQRPVMSWVLGFWVFDFVIRGCC